MLWYLTDDIRRMRAAQTPEERATGRLICWAGPGARDLFDLILLEPFSW